MSALPRNLSPPIPAVGEEHLVTKKNQNELMRAAWLITSGQADTAEKVGLDRTHPQEPSIQHHTPSPDLEPAGERGREAGFATVGGETLKQS